MMEMIQPKVMIGEGDRVCARYLKDKLEQGAWAALCQEHFDEVIAVRPDWISTAGPLGGDVWTDTALRASKALQSVKAAASGALG